MSGLYPLDSNSNEFELVTELLKRVDRRSSPAAQLFDVGKALAERLISTSFKTKDTIVMVIEAEELDSLGAGFLSATSKFSVSLVCLWAERILLKRRANFGKIAEREVVEIAGIYGARIPKMVDHLVFLQGSDVRANYLHTAIAKLSKMANCRSIAVATPVVLDDPKGRIVAEFASPPATELSIVALCGVTLDAPHVGAIKALRDRPAELLKLELGDFKVSYIPDTIAAILQRADLVNDTSKDSENTSEPAESLEHPHGNLADEVEPEFEEDDPDTGFKPM